jgi:transposase
VALDTSKRKHVGAVLEPGAQEPRDFEVPNELGALRRWARKVVREAAGEVRVCYEAGPFGFALQRQLEVAAPGLVCEVIVPALIPVRPGQRIKTDRRDARKLVRLYRAGELTVVHAPTEAEEAVRDLVRCREDAHEDLLRARHRPGKFLLRRGRIYAQGSAWTQRHAAWLASQVWEDEPDELVFQDYRLAIAQLEERLRGLDAHIGEISQSEPYREPVGWLRCFRGIDTVVAMTLLAEIHGFQRFEHAGDLMGYLGLVPSERTSAERAHRGALTKTGNAHVRRVLVEASWHQRHAPAVGLALRKRREGQPAWAIAHADRALNRLHRRYWRLYARGKPVNKVVAAVARELVGFVWAVMREGQMRQERSRNGSQRAAAKAA